MPSKAVYEGIWFVAQIIVIVLYATCCTFGTGMVETSDDPAKIALGDAAAMEQNMLYYPMWMDIHVMIFVGFGFLMVFLKTHCWTSVGVNYIAAAWCMQLCVLFRGFWVRVLTDHHDFSDKIEVDLMALLSGEFCAGAFLITMGALLGKATFPQLMFIATFESLFFTLNDVLIFDVLKLVDIGGAMTIHMFGAYFGLAATYFFENKRALAGGNDRQGGSYNSQLIAMVGTLFLFMYWPSFNGILGTGMQRNRAVVNTIISITASTLSAMFTSRLVTGVLDMEVLLNSTLAGGVVMGAAADMFPNPAVPMVCGACIGVISALGYLKMNSWCQEKLKLHDTCGVQFLHGIPGTIGSILAAICVAMYEDSFGGRDHIEQQFGSDFDRELSTQAGYQICGVLLVWVIAIPAGLLIGFLTSKLFKDYPAHQFDDKHTFHGVTYAEDVA